MSPGLVMFHHGREVTEVPDWTPEQEKEGGNILDQHLECDPEFRRRWYARHLAYQREAQAQSESNALTGERSTGPANPPAGPDDPLGSSPQDAGSVTGALGGQGGSEPGGSRRGATP